MLTETQKRHLASDIASADFMVKKYTAIRDGLKKNAIENGCAGETITTLDGKKIVVFSDGTEYALDETKIINAIGAERYMDILKLKRDKVKLSLSDVSPFVKKEDVSMQVDSSVKMYIRARADI